MGKLIYCAITSLDGYIADANGNFDWSAPDLQVHAFVNDLTRPLGTYLYGRELYDVMVFWESVPADDPEDVTRDFGEVWRAADKIVYSSTLDRAGSERTSIRSVFDPAEIRELKARSESDISVGGARLAGAALRAGLVDEIQQFIAPAIVGGGKRFLPDDVRLDLKLLEERRFENGTVFLRYSVAS
jgi:dihydrofolate reductase